jgi:Flp pilus assembly protein TadD
MLPAALLLGACATTGSPGSSARIEIQQDVGFTIIEKAHISGDVRADYEAALTLLEQEQYEQGLDLLEAVVEKAPNLMTPRIDLGIAYHRAGDLDAARESLLQALELNPDHPVALTELGIVYRRTGRFAEARQNYEAALAVYPGYHFARRNLAILCDLYLADLECALKNYEAYMTTVPVDDKAAIWIADIRQRLGE